MNTYDPTSIEQKWQQRWEEANRDDFNQPRGMNSYNPSSIEKKWQQRWEKANRDDFNQPRGMNSARGLKTATTRTAHMNITPYARDSVFANTSKASLMLTIIAMVSEMNQIQLHEAAIMPDHVHLLLSFQAGRCIRSDIGKKIKGSSARIFNKITNSDAPHLWGKHFHFDDISSRQQFNHFKRYIQSNPLKENIPGEGRILSVTFPEKGGSGLQSAQANSFA